MALVAADVHAQQSDILKRHVSQGIKPEVRTYNTIINACNRSGQPEAAMQVYERMVADGMQPSATTYTALISAYGKAGKVQSTLLGQACVLCSKGVPKSKKPLGSQQLTHFSWQGGQSIQLVQGRISGVLVLPVATRVPQG